MSDDGCVWQDSFSQILYMFLSEGVPVECAHSRCGRTALMAAAQRGLTDTAQQILRIGEYRTRAAGEVPLTARLCYNCMCYVFALDM